MKIQNFKNTTEKTRFKIREWRILSAICILFFIGSNLSCAIPSLEKPECREARQTVKQFYSYHFGNEMKFSKENLRQREKYLTPDLIKSLTSINSENDVFTTNTADFPKAFRIGKCTVAAPDKTIFEVLLFWKDEHTSKQQEISVEIVKQNEQWLINKLNGQ